MKSHYTAAELAALKLPGMPADKTNINRRANGKLWEYQERQGRGGGREYPVSALPIEAQRALMAREIDTAPSVPVPVSIDLPAAIPDAGSFKDYQRAVMEARVALLAEIDRLVRLGARRGRAVETLVEQACAGLLPGHLQALVPVANARAGKSGRTLSRATLYNWLKWRDRGAGSPALLAPVIPAESRIPTWAGKLLKLYGQPAKPGLCGVVALLRNELGESAPSYDQARRFVKRLDAISRHHGRLGPRALTQLRAYVARDVSELWPGAVVAGDGHTFKAEVAHPISGRPFRPEITSMIDVFTRRVLGWSVDLSESAISVAGAFTDCCVRATVPDMLYYDRGSGANNQYFDDPLTGLLARVGTTKINSRPWHSQSRGVIEIIHKTIMHPAAKTLPTYLGADMDKEARDRAYKTTRREIKETGSSRLLPRWLDFVALVDDAIRAYNARPHSSLPKRQDESGRLVNLSPDQAWNQAIAAGWQPSPVPEAEALDLFRPAMRRKTSRGLVELFGNRYFDRALEPLHGEFVRVGYDIHDATRVWVRRIDGRFVCEAKWNAHKHAFVPISQAETAREKRVDAQVRRLQTKIEAKEAGRVPALEHHAAPVADFIDITPVAQPTLVEIGGRPRFQGDIDYVIWLADNPDRLTDQDRVNLRGLLNSGNFRLMLEVEGVPIDPLKSLLVNPVQEEAAA